MEIEKTFVNSFRYLFLAKIRQVLRRSIFTYAIAAALIALGLRSLNVTAISTANIFIAYLACFLPLMAIVFLLFVIAAWTQSSRERTYTAVFSDDRILVRGNDGIDFIHKDWDWVKSVDETANYFALLIQHRPRYEWFLPKSRLTELEYRQFKDWFITKGKLVV